MACAAVAPLPKLAVRIKDETHGLSVDRSYNLGFIKDWGSLLESLVAEFASVPPGTRVDAGFRNYVVRDFEGIDYACNSNVSCVAEFDTAKPGGLRLLTAQWMDNHPFSGLPSPQTLAAVALRQSLLASEGKNVPLELHIEYRKVYRMDGPALLVKTLTGKTLRVPVEDVHTTTIEDLKAIIFNMEETPCDQQRLIYSGKQLEDGCTLADAGITDIVNKEVVLHLVLRLRGGMFHDSSGRCDYNQLPAERQIHVLLPNGAVRVMTLAAGEDKKDFVAKVAAAAVAADAPGANDGTTDSF